MSEVIDSMITWLDQHAGDGVLVSTWTDITAEDPRTWREVYDAGVVTDSDVTAAWMSSQATAMHTGNLDTLRTGAALLESGGDADDFRQAVADLLWNAANRFEAHPDATGAMTQGSLRIARAVISANLPSRPAGAFELHGARYVVTDKNGSEVRPGDTVTDFRGQHTVIRRVSRSPGGASSGRVQTDAGEYYPSVFDLEIERAQ